MLVKNMKDNVIPPRPNNISVRLPSHSIRNTWGQGSGVRGHSSDMVGVLTTRNVIKSRTNPTVNTVARSGFGIPAAMNTSVL